MQAYHGQGSAWRWRYLYLTTYANVLYEPAALFPSDADIEAMRQIVHNTSAPIAERLEAQSVLDFIAIARGERFASAKVARKMTRLAALASAEHRAEVVPSFDDIKEPLQPCWQTIGERIDERLRKMHMSLPLIAGEYDSHTMPDELATRLAGIPQAVQAKMPGVSWPAPPEAQDSHYADIRAAQRDRTLACSQCGARDVKLARCGRCEVAHYCSPACQRAGWKAHKPQCRVPGEHHVGDVVRLKLLRARPCLNGQYARVLAEDASRAGRWLVENENWPDSTTSSVRRECLQCVLTH